MINDLLELGRHPLATLLSLAFGVLGILLAFVFFLKSRRIRSFDCSISSHSLVSNLNSVVDGLEVRFQNVPQERITASRIALWNSGNETIDKTSLTLADPFGFIIDDGATVLDARIVYQEEPANQLRVGEFSSAKNGNPGQLVPITFDYMDPGDGAIIQIVHTGDQGHRIKINGVVKGLGRISQKFAPGIMYMRQEDLFKIQQNRHFQLLTGLILIIPGVICLYQVISTKTHWTMWVLTIFLWLFMALFATGFVTSKIPPSLRDKM